MKISASVEYGTRLMTRLARLPVDEAMNAEKLSALENIPRAYVDQLLSRLRRAGLVKSHRGARGGYGLARPADQVTVGMVMRAIEGHIFEDACGPYSAGDHQCGRVAECGIKTVWQRLVYLVEDFLDKMTLAGLLRDSASENHGLEQWLRSARPLPLFGRDSEPGRGRAPRP